MVLTGNNEVLIRAKRRLAQFRRLDKSAEKGGQQREALFRRDTCEHLFFPFPPPPLFSRDFFRIVFHFATVKVHLKLEMSVASQSA